MARKGDNISIYLSYTDQESLDNQRASMGLTRSKYISHLINKDSEDEQPEQSEEHTEEKKPSNSVARAIEKYEKKGNRN